MVWIIAIIITYVLEMIIGKGMLFLLRYNFSDGRVNKELEIYDWVIFVVLKDVGILGLWSSLSVWNIKICKWWVLWFTCTIIFNLFSTTYVLENILKCMFMKINPINVLLHVRRNEKNFLISVKFSLNKKIYVLTSKNFALSSLLEEAYNFWTEGSL